MRVANESINEYTIPAMAVSPITFLKEVRIELGNVVWPTREQLVRLTALVVVISLVVALFIGAIDFIFFKVMEILL